MVGELLVKPLAFSQLTILFVFEGANVSVCPSPDISEQRLYEREWTTQCKAHVDSLRLSHSGVEIFTEVQVLMA